MVLTTVSKETITTVYALSSWPDIYADYVNNFMTVSRWAEYYGLTDGQANEIVAVGRLTDNFSKNFTF